MQEPILSAKTQRTAKHAEFISNEESEHYRGTETVAVLTISDTISSAFDLSVERPTLPSQNRVLNEVIKAM